MQYVSLRWSSQFIFTRPFKGKGVILNDIFERQEIISICFAHGYNLLWKLVYAFDRVNHSLLFDKLCARDVPFYLIRLLVYWYEHQRMCVRWGGVYSGSFMLLSHCGEYPCECKKKYSRQIRQKVANIRRMGLRMQFATNRNDRKMIARHS